MNLVFDKEILRLANKKLVYRSKLQIAYDRLMANDALKIKKNSDKLWRDYLKHGGDRTMRDAGIDLDNWKRVKRVLKNRMTSEKLTCANPNNLV